MDMKKNILEKANRIQQNIIKEQDNIRIFIATRVDRPDWDECEEQTILAYSKEEALELAEYEYGEWKVEEIENLTPQVLTQSFIWG